MTSTRTGKIARLPLPVRDQLNGRLLDGERHQLLVDWLNALPAVQAVLAAEFAGAPVTEQNLSAWKQGGYADWLHQQESRAALRGLLEDADGLKAAQGDSFLADRLAPLVTLALGRRLQQVAAAAPDDPAQLATLLDLARALTRQRRCDHAAARFNREREHWAAENALALAQDRLAAEKLRQEQEEIAQRNDRRARRDADFFRLHGHMPFEPPPPLGTSPAPELLQLLAALPPNPATLRPAAHPAMPSEIVHLLHSMGSDPAAIVAGLPLTAQPLAAVKPAAAAQPPAVSRPSAAAPVAPPPPAPSPTSGTASPAARTSASVSTASSTASSPRVPSGKSTPSPKNSAPRSPDAPPPPSIQPNPGQSSLIQPKINSPAAAPSPLAC